VKKTAVKLVEVGPRDGLQNISRILSFEEKKKFLSGLIECGFTEIEIGSFVREEIVPQMATTSSLCSYFLTQYPELEWIALVPNVQGFEKALESKVKHIAIFTAISETFNQKNIRTSIEGSRKRFDQIFSTLSNSNSNLNSNSNSNSNSSSDSDSEKVKVRAYISTVFGCPYEGRPLWENLWPLIDYFIEKKVREISLADTIGVATVEQVRTLTKDLKKKYPEFFPNFAYHFHDTSGFALVNTFAAFEMGIQIFDGSTGGIGGCPFAGPMAKGNVSMELLGHFFDSLKVETGLNLERLDNLASWIKNLVRN